MDIWADYVRRFYELSPEQQQKEWEKLSPEQRQQFTAARAKAVPQKAQATPPSKPSRSKIGAKGCMILVALAILGIAGLALIGNIEKRRSERQAQEEARLKEEQAAAERQQKVDYFRENGANVLTQVKDLLDRGEFQDAIDLTGGYLVSEDEELKELHDRARTELEARERQEKIDSIVAELKLVPAVNTVRNRDLYRQLTGLDPDEPRYAEKLAFYSRKLQEQVDSARLEREREEKERKTRLARFGAEPKQSSWDGSYLAVKQYLRRVANDPDSIKIDGCTEVYHTKTGWLVGCDYRGRNAFGGMVRQSNWLTIVHNTVVEMHDASDFKP